MLYIFLVPLALFLLAYLWLRFRSSKLAGEDLRAYDATPKSFATAQPSEGLDRLNDFIHQMFISTSKEAKENNYAHQWVGKRERFDAMSLARDFAETEFVPDVITGRSCRDITPINAYFICMAGPSRWAAILAIAPSPYSSRVGLAWLSLRPITA